MSSLRARAKRLEKQSKRDYDPEDDRAVTKDESSSEEDGPPQFNGREHYQAVSKSKLKESEQLQLGKKYGGVAVSRTVLEDDDEKDPFAPVDEDEEKDPFAGGNGHQGDSDISEEVDDDDVDMAQESGAHIYKANETDDDSDSLSEGDDAEDEPHSGDFDDDLSENTSTSSHSSQYTNPERRSDRRELLDLIKSDTARVVATLSTTEDIKQGRAVRQQQTASDRLLDARMKLQKGLTSFNSLSEIITNIDAKDAIDKAEAAALSLWSTLDSIQTSFLSAAGPATDNVQTEKRKKLQPFNPSSATHLSDIWAHSQSHEKFSASQRLDTLNYWSSRTRPSGPSHHHASRSLTSEGISRDPPLTDILSSYLQRESTKLISSSTTSPTPSNGPNNPSIPSILSFSDDNFYQSLLRDLIASRTDTPFTNNPTTLPNPSTSTSTSQTGKPNPINNQRNRRNVDTKASKGRKIRYTVHEKLVSFMAPEDRSSWSDSARREFFGSLFGRRPGKEGDGYRDGGGHDGDGDMDMDVDVDLYGDERVREEGALRLFQS